MTVKIAWNMITKIVGPSPNPNQTIAKGTHEVVGICRNEFMNGAMVRITKGEYPMSIPKGKPMIVA